MNLEKTVIEIGLEKPLKILHVTDTHLALCDDRDDERKQALARKRAVSHVNVERDLKEQIAYAETNCDLLVHTGDLMDFISKANVEKSRIILQNEKILYIAGNHDYSQYMGEAWEDMTYRMNSYMSLGEGGLGVNMFFTSRIVGGVNFVGVDNAYHQVEEWQTERLRYEVQKGSPVILCMHAPLFEQALYERSIDEFKDGSAYVMGCDEEHLMTYPEFRACEQRPTEATKKFVAYVNSESRIKAVLAGHLHFNFASMLSGGAMQYVTGGGYRNIAREITIL